MCSGVLFLVYLNLYVGRPTNRSARLRIAARKKNRPKLLELVSENDEQNDDALSLF
jgi:hypothetical protein